MLSAIAGFLGSAGVKAIVDGLFSRLAPVLEMWVKKQITEAELREKLAEALLATFADVDKHFADAINSGFANFLGAARQSKQLMTVYMTVALSQLFVLLWYQFAVPAIVTLGWVEHYARAGTTVDWAYAIILLCLGGGSMTLRFGPAGSLAGMLKSLIGK